MKIIEKTMFFYIFNVFLYFYISHQILHVDGPLPASRVTCKLLEGTFCSDTFSESLKVVQT